MERITSSSKSDNVKLTGVIEADEFYIKAGLKGRSYHNEILNSVRLLPRDRGLKAWKGRGTFEKDTPMIKCVHQRGGMTYFDLHNTKQSLISNIRRLINCHHNTKVYTDEYLAYENLNKYGFISSVAQFTYSFVLYLSVYVFIATKMLYNDAFITNSLVML